MQNETKTGRPYPYRKLRLGNGHTVLEHRRVWEQIHGPIPNKLIIHHINEDGKDNDPQNLQLTTRKWHFFHHQQYLNLNHLTKEAKHGSVSSYRRGCRCDLCKETQRLRMQKYRRTHRRNH